MFKKKIVKNLEKCYCVAPLIYKGRLHILVAAEKHSPCYLFTPLGEYVDTVWTEPGGVMSMVQIPGTDGEFLATHRFYSPNDSAEASIVYVKHTNDRGWVVKELVKLPFVHRFDILPGEKCNYLIACTLKSGHSFKDDWSSPGKVYGCILPETLEGVTLKPKVIYDNMVKNHGYTRYVAEDGSVSAVISCDDGVYSFKPPDTDCGEWKISRLLASAASDAICMDLDGDGAEELFVMSPFHGNQGTLYKKDAQGFNRVMDVPGSMEFLHALGSGTYGGVKSVVFGYRKGDMKLLRLYFDRVQGEFKLEEIDRQTGPANVLCYDFEGGSYIMAANRETDEIALYKYMK